MNIKAIPTFYNGVQFRSRLEARWASFFDLIGWPWAYEAIDLNGWIPDFILGENLDTGIPCEVKPIDFLGLSRAEREQSWQPHSAQLKRAATAVGPDSGFMLLGSRPFWGGDFYAATEFRGHIHLTDVGVSFYPCFQKYNNPEPLSRRETDGKLDFVIERAPYRGAVTRLVFDHGEEEIDPFVILESEIIPIWKEASNTVQWKAP